jgi:hypothetical protein
VRQAEHEDRGQAPGQVVRCRQDLRVRVLEPPDVSHRDGTAAHLDRKDHEPQEPQRAPLDQRRDPVVVRLLGVGRLLVAKELLGGVRSAADQVGPAHEPERLPGQLRALVTALRPAAEGVAQEGIAADMCRLHDAVLLGVEDARRRRERQGDDKCDSGRGATPRQHSQDDTDGQSREQTTERAERAGEDRVHEQERDGRRTPAAPTRVARCGDHEDGQDEVQPRAVGVGGEAEARVTARRT